MRFQSQIQKLHNLFIAPLPAEFLQQRRYVRVQGEINQVLFTGYAGSSEGSWETRDVMLLLPADFMEFANLHEGDSIEADLAILTTDLREQRVHPQLAAALAREQLDLSVLPPYERRQHLSAVNETIDETTRRLRIEAVVAACRHP